MTKTVGSGEFTYEIEEDWAKLPDGWEMNTAAVAGDSHDRIYAFDRGDNPVMVFDREGNYLHSWGHDQIKMAHAIYIDPQDNVWLVDSHGGQIMKFTPEGTPLMTIGIRDYRSDTGVDAKDFRSDTHLRVTHAGGPFNIPAGVAVAPSGEVFVADGYANCRVHRFTGEGDLMTSWGEPGNAPGQFNLPHGVTIDRHGRVIIADRENDRIQLFTQDGESLGAWPTKLIGPAAIHIDEEDIVYVPEAQCRALQHSYFRRRAAGPMGLGSEPLLPRGLGGLLPGRLLCSTRRIRAKASGGQIQPKGLGCRYRHFCENLVASATVTLPATIDFYPT